MRIFDSIVQHKSLLGRKNKYVEGCLNKVEGTLHSGNKLLVSFTNSHGDPTVLLGRAWTLGPFVFTYGSAHGYSGHENGRFVATVGLKTKSKLHFCVPHGLSEILVVSVRYIK